MKSLVHMKELCSRSVPPEHAPGAKPFVCIGLKEEETSLVSEATPKGTQYNTKWGRKVFKEWQQRRQNTCAMLEVVGVADLKCEDVQDLTFSLEHMSAITLNFWLSKFVCESKRPSKMESVIRPIRFICQFVRLTVILYRD